MSVALPEQLADFLEFRHYEINFLLKDMAKFFFKGGDLLLQQNEPMVFNPLQVNFNAKASLYLCNSYTPFSPLPLYKGIIISFFHFAGTI